MGILTAALTILLQEPAGSGDLRFEDVKIIAERNIFSPVKPKDAPKKKEETKKEEKKAESPLLPIVTGFEGYPDGFRVLILDRTKNASARYGVGDSLAGGILESIDMTRAVVKMPTGGTIELRNGDAISGGGGIAPPAPNASAIGRFGAGLASVVEKKSDGETAVQGKKKKKVAGEEEEDDRPRKKKRWNRP